MELTKASKTKIEGDITQDKTTSGVGRRFKNKTRETCSYIKRGATINIISNDLGSTDTRTVIKWLCFAEQMIWLIIHVGRQLFQ